tara:strand:+ start:998 stop:1669 length:672 start_codon:yes stop_codon:yes gene_type:complete
MKNLTLVIPAKREKESLPDVLEELKKYEFKILVVLEENDIETIEAIKKFDCEILYQKNKGYGDALIHGINNVQTELFCIFNADGSFNPKELSVMQDKIYKDNFDFVFASRYEKNCSSEDDTWVTFVGNFIFSKIGNIFFNLKITDILYTYVIGKTILAQQLNLTRKDFVFCVELPIKAKRQNLKITTSKSNERARIGGKKKVNAIKDGFLILIAMIKLFFRSN